jgi:hypothetical protein
MARIMPAKLFQIAVLKALCSLKTLYSMLLEGVDAFRSEAGALLSPNYVTLSSMNPDFLSCEAPYQPRDHR